MHLDCGAEDLWRRTAVPGSAKLRPKIRVRMSELRAAEHG